MKYMVQLPLNFFTYEFGSYSIYGRLSHQVSLSNKPYEKQIEIETSASH